MEIKATVATIGGGTMEARLRQILAGLQQGGPDAVKVGFPAGRAASDVLDIAVWNHFGTRRIPARPFIKVAFFRGRAAARGMMERMARAIIAGQMTMQQALGLMGQWGMGQIQTTIASSIPPPNAPSTVERKGSSTTLIDTGRMRQAVTWDYDST